MGVIDKYLPERAGYRDIILAYWLYLSSELRYRYEKLYLQYRKVLHLKGNTKETRDAVEELIKLRAEIVSVVGTILGLIEPFLGVSGVYENTISKIKNKKIRELIEKYLLYDDYSVIAEERKKLVLEYNDIDDIMQMIRATGVVLVALNVISMSEGVGVR